MFTKLTFFVNYISSLIQKHPAKSHEKGKDKRGGGSSKSFSKSDAKKDDANYAYAKKKNVQNSLGKCQKLKVIGFVFTKETFGARIELSPEQVELFDQVNANEAQIKNRPTHNCVC